MSEERVIALLGRRDEPTDAVEEYCQHLGEALASHEFKLEIRRVPWNERGWRSSIEALRLQAESWGRTWVLVQYTALAWSARGFPTGVLKVLRVLRRAGARISVVFHDAEPFGGSRLVDRLRRAIQLRIMRRALVFSEQAVLTVPATALSWIGSAPNNSAFIPVGPNLPQPLAEQDHTRLHTPPTVAIFSVTGGAPGDTETHNIIETIRFACSKVGRLRLLAFGRHAEVREEALRKGLQELPVELEVEGVIEGNEVVRRFAASDVLLFLRGIISSRRGSAISGIACGLPVIAMRGSETAAPITDAGTILVSNDLDKGALPARLGEALVQVLSNDSLRRELVERSRDARARYFDWHAIAKRYTELLRRK